jgi:uncharacterized protein (DUF58 family)
VRLIDWNVTARQARPFVKTYQAELGATVLLLVDTSASMTAAGNPRKHQVLTELVALFALIGARHGDRVGALFFGDTVHHTVRPGRGPMKVREIIRAAEEQRSSGGRTRVGDACAAAHRLLRRTSIVLLISDFHDSGYSRRLRLLSLRHDLVGVALVDPDEAQPPSSGLFRVTDPESRRSRWIDGASARVRAAWAERWRELQARRRQAFSDADVPCVDIAVDRSYMPALLQLCRTIGPLG